MRIGLIEACDPDWQFKRFSYSLQLGYLASFLHSQRSDDRILIAEEPEELIEYKPDIIGISSYSINYDIAKSLGKRFREELGVPVILGGCHISTLPETFDRSFDVAVLGEGEKTFVRLIDTFARDGKLIPEKLKKIRGLLYYDGDEVVKTKNRSPFIKLDMIPPPARELFKVRSGHHYISTSRGCPFKCRFCAPRVMWKRTRYFSAPYVMMEIARIMELFGGNFTHLSVVDDLFIANRKRLEELKDFFIQFKLNELLVLQGNVRSDLIDDEMAEILKQMNFKTVNFGAESGSDKILEYYNKHNTVGNNQKAIDVLYNHGIKAIPSFIIGAPVETEDDFKMTIDFIEKNHHKMAGFEIFPLIPMPGSEMWTYAREKGIVDNNIEWNRLEPLLLDFDPDRYIYLNEAVSKETFLDYVKRFQDIYAKYNPDAMAFRESLNQWKEDEKRNKNEIDHGKEE